MKYAYVSHDLLSLDAIEQRVRKLASQLEAPRSLLPTFERSQHDGTPHIEVGRTYAFVVCERGSEFARRSTASLDELLYWIFQSVTFSMASGYELDHRQPAEDPRRQLFAKQVTLLTSLSDEWGKRRASEHREILAEHPFVDQ